MEVATTSQQLGHETATTTGGFYWVSNPWVRSPINVAANTRTSDHLVIANGSQIVVIEMKHFKQIDVLRQFCWWFLFTLTVHSPQLSWFFEYRLTRPFATNDLLGRSVSLKIFIQGNSITMIVTTKPNPRRDGFLFNAYWDGESVVRNFLGGIQGRNGGKCCLGKNE